MLTFELRGLKNVRKGLRGLKDYFTNLKPLLRETRDEFHEMIEGNFKRKGPPGERWRAHARSTKRMRAERRGSYSRVPSSPSLLAWTGGLKRSLTGKGRFTISKISSFGKSFKLSVGTNHPLALIHHVGGTIRRPSIKAGKRGGVGALTLFTRSGDVIFSSSAGPASIKIPSRRFYSQKQITTLLANSSRRAGKKAKFIWQSA